MTSLFFWVFGEKMYIYGVHFPFLFSFFLDLTLSSSSFGGRFVLESNPTTIHQLLLPDLAYFTYKRSNSLLTTPPPHPSPPLPPLSLSLSPSYIQKKETMPPQTSIPPAANILGTIGTVFWCVQLVPQIWHNWKSKNTDGLPRIMMLLWAICKGVF